MPITLPRPFSHLVGREKDIKWPDRDTSAEAWVSCLTAAITNAAGLSLMFSFGLFLVPIALEFDVGRGTVSWAITFTSLAGVIMGIPSGMLSQKFGSQPVIFASGVCCVVGSVWSAYAANVGTLYFSFGCVFGCVAPLGVIISLSAVSTYFDKYRALAVGATSLGTGIGQLVIPYIAEALLDSDIQIDDFPAIPGRNWRAALFWLGLGSGILAMASALFVRTRPDVEGGALDEKNDDDDVTATVEMGKVESGESPGSASKQPQSTDTASRKPSVAKNDGEEVPINRAMVAPGEELYVLEGKAMIKAALSRPYFATFLAVGALTFFAFQIPLVHAAAYIADQGEDVSKQALLLSLIGASQIAGKLFHGWLADRYGTITGMITGTTLMGIFGILWTTVPYSYVWVCVYISVHGFNFGTVTTHITTMVAEYFQGCNPATLSGLYFSFGSLFGFVGPTLAGYVFDWTGTYDPVGFMCGIPFLIATAVLIKMDRIRKAEDALREKLIAEAKLSESSESPESESPTASKVDSPLSKGDSTSLEFEAREDSLASIAISHDGRED